MDIQLKAIGRVASPYKQKFCTPRQALLSPEVTSKIVLESWLPEGVLSDLDEFSHIWVFSYFHKKGPSRVNGKIRPPRLEGEKKGVLSTRAPHRPNPIGLSLVRLKSIDYDRRELLISAPDLIDGTPILDIKPYIPSYDQVDHPTVVKVGWLGNRDETFFKVEFSTQASSTLDNLSNPNYRALLNQTLKYEVRNLADRDSNNSNQVYKSMIGDFDVHFRYEDTTVVVVKLEKL
jgi:tRNA-Thr(GGU) m(6)t(6)A37 methyltransferase TsaA